MKTETFLERVKQNTTLFGIPFSKQYDYSSVLENYPINIKQTSKIHIKCKDHGLFTIQMGHHLYHSHGCQQCAELSRTRKSLKTKADFLQTLFERFPENRELFDYSETVYSGSVYPIIFRCIKCGMIHTQRASNHLTFSKRCSCNGGRTSKAVQDM